ncbi:hypothetical protein OH76DRAFT_1363125 [Lentinus brumalis]|uniref:CxC6 like cysteine cluster associated with KDZ domain-containing protein n=1 Tax=Lentinus brumalis TaxID=2498619 RepID=A0A371CPU3_9APHY|nr:hypothetical protein OH76DRAFT_1363125 [Polyporus brumalis]
MYSVVWHWCGILTSFSGVEVMISARNTCATSGCARYGKYLGQRRDYPGHLYTRKRGVLPVRITSMYCRGCHTTYRPNYSVCNAQQEDAERRYYEGIPDVLEISEHSYVERELVGLFRAQMCFAHASADVVARVYNLGLSDSTAQDLSGELVWNAFYLHALLDFKHRRSEHLELPHNGAQTSRRGEQAADERNRLMTGTGQPLWAHACDDCERIIRPPPDDPSAPWQRLSACVMDGVTVGHPRCNAPRCEERLRSPRDRYCQSHAGEGGKCAMDGCSNAVSGGFRTCDTAEHRAYEIERRQKGQAIFRPRLHHSQKQPSDRRRAKAKNASKTPRAPRIKTSLTRRWTHNEQLMVRCCGIVISRATFFESEGPANALRFVLATFPDHFPRARPSFLFYDNNCHLLRHIRTQKTPGLERTAFPVDVFHATTKHTDSDEFCVNNCNPALFPELYNDLMEWIFNSSAAEQVNVWFGKFIAVVREMNEVHYNFFLDEMITVYNAYREVVLAKKGKHPRLVPVEELKLPL